MRGAPGHLVFTRMLQLCLLGFGTHTTRDVRGSGTPGAHKDAPALPVGVWYPQPQLGEQPGSGFVLPGMFRSLSATKQQPDVAHS